MEPQNHQTDWVDAELRELFDSAVADAERSIDVDERHRQWLVGSQLRTLDPGSSQTGDRVGWRDRQSWPKLLSAGTVAAVAVAAVALFPYQSGSQQFVVANDDSEFVNDPTGGISETPEPGVGSKPNSPTSQATTIPTPSSEGGSKLVVTASTGQTSQTQTTTVSTPVGPSTTEGSKPAPTFKGQPTTASTTDSSTTAPAATKPTSTTEPTVEASTSTTWNGSKPPIPSLTTTESIPSSTGSTFTVTELQMVVAIEASDPSGTIVRGTTLESELLISAIKTFYILPQQCQQVGLTAPPGYRFDGDGRTPGTVTKSIEICPTDDDPSELTLFETVIDLAG